jgi:hypothetical protein
LLWRVVTERPSDTADRHPVGIGRQAWLDAMIGGSAAAAAAEASGLPFVLRPWRRRH